MLIAAVIALCILLAILGLLVPRLSNQARRGADKGFSTGAKNTKDFGVLTRQTTRAHGAGRRCPYRSRPFRR